jgi:putative MATE family efflux protein
LRASERTALLGTQNIPRLLFRLSAPAITGMLVNSLYNLVDTIFVGQGVGTTALAALAVCFPIQIFMLAVAQTVGIGSASIISRALGSGDHDTAEKVASGSFTLTTALALALSVTGLLFVTPLLRLFGASGDVLPYGRDYLSVILLGGVFFANAVCSNNLVRSEGNARTAMNSMLIGAGTNIILDPVFIFALGLGIRGAAIATVIGQACSFTYLMLHFGRRKNHVRIRREYILPGISTVLQVLRIGSASFARVFAGSLLAIVMNNAIVHFGQDLHLAVLGVVNRIVIFSLMPIFGLVQGLQPIIGYNYGARSFARVKSALKYSCLVATGIITFMFLILELFPTLVLKVFSRDATLIAAGAPILQTLVAMTPLIGFQIVAASMFQALGKAWKALFLSTSRQVLLLIPLVLVLPGFFSTALDGVWIAAPAADFLSAVLTGWLFMLELRKMRAR